MTRIHQVNTLFVIRSEYCKLLENIYSKYEIIQTIIRFLNVNFSACKSHGIFFFFIGHPVFRKKEKFLLAKLIVKIIHLQICVMSLKPLNN